VLTWNVVGGNPGHVTTYRVTADEFTIQKNGTIIFDDTFADANQPPGQPPLSTTQLTIADGRAVLDSANATTAFSIPDPSLDFTGLPTGFIGNFASVFTNNDPTNTTLGLKSGSSFQVSAVYDLVSSEADYGIRLSNGDGSIQFPGDDVVDLAVWPTLTGGLQVELNQINFFGGSMTLLGSAPITINPGDDQILLTLTHNAPSSGPDTGLVTASFTVLHSGVPDYTVTIGGMGEIFQTGDWTRAGFEAVAPGNTSSFVNGIYGALAINQNGAWTYLLHNNQANVQALAAGQHVTDSFQVQVTDQFGATDTKTINVDVAGNNDAPTLQAPIAAAPVLANDTLTLTDTLAFTDLDLTDTHAVTFTPQGTGYVGDFVPTIIADANGHGSISTTFHLTRDQVMANGGVFPDHQDYLVTVDDQHGGTSSQIVSIPLAQIIGDNGGNDGGNNNNSPPVIFINTSAHDTATGLVFDDAAHPDRQHIIGRLSFTDPEASQFHNVSVVGVTPGPRGIVGTMSASIERNSDGTVFGSGDPDGFLAASPDGGVIKWDYQVDEQRIQSLGQGETYTDHFQMMLQDDSGGFTTQDIFVNIIGQNDLPTLAGDAQPDVTTLFFRGAFSDTDPFPFIPGNFQTQGFGFLDPDQNDHHTVSSVLDLAHSTVNASADFNVTLTKDTHQFGPGDIQGELRWTYELLDLATPYLPGDEGRQREQTWDIIINDGHGQTTVPFVVTFNSAATIQGPSTDQATFPITQGETNTWSFQGNLAFDDVDPNDQHTVSAERDPTLMHGQEALGTLTATMLNDTSNGTGGLLHFDYELTPSQAANVLPGQSWTDAFDIGVDDGHGGVATHTVLVTLNGQQVR
jgi:VCBS repeat-containing protein